MKLIIDIDKEKYNQIINSYQGSNVRPKDYEIAVINGTPIPDNATNGDVIKTMFGDDKVSAFMGYVRIMAKVGNWCNEGVVAEFDKDWWNAPYQKGGTNEKQV